MPATGTAPPPTASARPRRRVRPVAVLAVLVVVALLTGGTVWASTDPGPSLRGLRILVPNASGGGYDVTARSAAKTFEDTGLTAPVEVFSLPGAGGVVGLGRTVSEYGNDRLLLSMGLGLVGSARSRDATGLLARTTPIARLTRETEVVVVAAGSPYHDLRTLVDAWRADPAGFAVGGGSSQGGPDHLATMLVAEGIGLTPPSVDYLAHDGGGELLASLLAGRVRFGVSGLGEFADQIDSGALRVLAVTAGGRVPGVAAPTLRESGIDVEFTNWRGVLAPPGLTEEQRTRLVDAYADLVRTPEWQDVLRRNRWQDAYLPGPEFGGFLTAEEQRVGHVLTELGLD